MKKTVTVTKDAASKTGYNVNVTYVNKEATDVYLRGSFRFYKSSEIASLGAGYFLPPDESIEKYLYTSEEWDEGMKNIDEGEFVKIKMKEEGGVWSASLALPCSVYYYYFSVSYDNGKTWQNDKGPDTEWGAKYSVFSVPFDKERHSDDWSWIEGEKDEEKKGKVELFDYTGLDGKTLKGGLYLPPHYDKERKTPYKTLYLVHGTGGDAVSWLALGRAHDIADRIFSQNKAEEFLIVTPSCDDYRIEDKNSRLGFDWDHSSLSDNLFNVLIPMIEGNYNVSAKSKDRALSGFSRGAMFANEVYFSDPPSFGYFGLFSGSAAWDWMKWEDIEEMKKSKLYIGAGYADRLLFPSPVFKDVSAMGIKQLLEINGIGYEKFEIVPGGHDWYTWTQLLRNFIISTLWKE